MLGSCAAHQQMIWLDACHSGSITLRGSKEKRHLVSDNPLLLDPTSQLHCECTTCLESKGFYALVSCDQGQRSWDFWARAWAVYLLLNARAAGEAADPQGVIEADGHKYVYYQTLQYIEKINQQLRLMNQQKQSRETPLSGISVTKHRNGLSGSFLWWIKTRYDYFFSATSAEWWTFTEQDHCHHWSSTT